VTPYQRIVHASRLGLGCRLSVAEVATLASDHAILIRSELDDAGVDCDQPSAQEQKDYERRQGERLDR
jgi:hypothetical protein